MLGGGAPAYTVTTVGVLGAGAPPDVVPTVIEDGASHLLVASFLWSVFTTVSSQMSSSHSLARVGRNLASFRSSLLALELT
jgi:hypothetical protein